MFIGHFAVAMAGKRLAPGVSLGMLFLAAQLVDLVWPVFLLLGLERMEIDPGNTAFTPLDFVYYPLTHSLVAGFGWAFALGALWFAFRRDVRGAFVVGVLVLSHWVLDFVTHRPDLPISLDSGPKVGLGLWNSVPATLAVESTLFALGVFLYVRLTRATRRRGLWAFWSLVGFLVLTYVANVVGPPPPDARAVAWVGLATWLLPLWAWWADRNREATVRISPHR